jgi:hypothetical protein
MTQAAAQLPLSHPRASVAGRDGAALFAGVAIALMLGAALLAGSAPIGFSIVTVFLFAGPHNWIEFRYFLSKMPAHWGPLRGFFILAIAGVLALGALFAAIPFIGKAARWDEQGWGMASSVWNSLLLLWIAALALLRGKEKRGRKVALGKSSGNWAWAVPAALGLIALVWIVPQAWDIGLVYLHPLIALLFLDRELGRRRPQWRPAYRACLACLPLVLAVLWWQLAGSAPLAGQDMLTMRITNHAGANILSGVSSHLLVSTHTFLEMLHYGVWLIAIPLVAVRAAPWKLQSVPLFRRSRPWRNVTLAAVAAGALAVLVLWGCFLGNYPATRDVYFTLAIAHVLVEFPFLLRTF